MEVDNIPLFGLFFRAGFSPELCKFPCVCGDRGCVNMQAFEIHLKKIEQVNTNHYNHLQLMLKLLTNSLNKTRWLKYLRVKEYANILSIKQRKYIF